MIGEPKITVMKTKGLQKLIKSIIKLSRWL
jgi:hypothetical protein